MIKNKTISDWMFFTVGIIILFMLFLGQTMSFINYEFTVSLGLQESIEQIGSFGVAVNKGFGISDTIIYIPLMLIGLIGTWTKKKWGIWSMIAALGITIYWPVVCLAIIFLSEGVPDVQFTDIMEYVLILSFITFYGIWGLWYLYKYYSLE